MKYCGVDQSLSASGFAIINTENGGAWTKTICPPKELIGGARLAWLRVALLDELRLGITEVGMEGYALSMPGRNLGKDTSQLMELGGVIKEVCAHRGIRLRVLTSSQVKKWATGSGDGGRARLKALYPVRSASGISGDVKDCCLVGMRSMWPDMRIDNDNEADALAIAHILTCVDGHMEATTPAQWEVIKAIAKPKKKPTRKKAAKKGTVLL